MKKFSFAAILLLAALLVMPGLALCQQGAAPAGAQANKFEVALVKTALLMAEQSISAETGNRAEIKYASLVVEGEKLVLEGVTLTINYKKAPTTLSIKRMVVSDLEPTLGKQASLGLSAVLQDVSGNISPKVAVKATLVEWEGLLIGFDQQSVSAKSFKAQAVDIVADDGSAKVAALELSDFYLDEKENLKIGAGSVTGFAFSEGKPGPKAHGTSIQIAMASVKGLMVADEGEKMQVAEAVVKDAKGGDGGDQFSIVSGSLKGFFFDEDKEQLRIDEGQAEGIKGGERKETFSLASIEIKKLDIDGEDHVVCRYLKATDFKFVEMGKQGPRNGVDLFSLVVAGVDFAKLDDPKSYGIGKIELLKLGVLVEGNQLLTVQRAATTSSKSGTLSKMLLVVEALTINAKGLPPEATGFFKQIGHDQAVFNLRIEGSLDHAKQLLDLGTFSITSAQLGELSYAIKMGGIQVDPKNPMMSAMKMQGTASLIDAKVDYVDRGLVPAMIEMVAKQNKQPPAQFKEMLIAQVRGNPKAPKGPAFQALAEEVVKFIQSPGELHLSVHPDKPVKMDDLQKLNEEQVIQLLKVKINTKPAAKM